MSKRAQIQGVTLAVLFLLFGAKRVAIEIWSKDAYRDNFHYACGIAAVLVAGIGMASILRDRSSK